MAENDIIINDGFTEDNNPPVQIFNEKSQNLNWDVIITSISISVSDVLTKVQSFNNYYKDTMIKLRKENPEEWHKLLNTLKATYAQGNVPLDVVVELISALTIEYEIGLQENDVITEFSKALHAFKNKE